MIGKVVNPVNGRPISAMTAGDYEKRFADLTRRYFRTRGAVIRSSEEFDELLSNINGESFLNWLIGRKLQGEFSNSTWRQYKASVAFAFCRLVDEGHPWVTQIDLDRIKDESQAGTNKRGQWTSSNKQKWLKQSELDRIIAYLSNAVEGSEKPRVWKLKYAQPLLDLLKGNVHVGLRPEEYRFAIVDGDELTVRNAKESDERAHGKFRHLNISYLPEHVIESIERTGQAFRATFWHSWRELCFQLGESLFAQNCLYFELHPEKLKGRCTSIQELTDALLLLDQKLLSPEILEIALKAFDDVSTKPVEVYYLALRKNMRKVVQRVFSQRVKSKLPTIYSTRHQCSANLKRAGISHAEVAAILGHKIERTNQVHYARKARGEISAGLVMGRADEIEKVKKFTEERAARHEANADRRKDGGEPEVTPETPYKP